MNSKPTGLVTFLFTDIEGSTKLSQEFPDTLQSALDRHHSIMHTAIESNNGFVFEIVGDAFCCAFGKAEDAVKAAVDAQRNLASAGWDEAEIKIRIGIHSGFAEWNGKKYVGYITLAKSSRIMSCGHGEQIIISNSTYELTKDKFDSVNERNISFRDLGERRLKDLNHPERLFQIVSDGIRYEFPPLKTIDARPNNLPFMLTNFIGRESSMIQVKNFLKHTRIVTITGSGGGGKTRLALQIGADMIDEFQNGVFIAELATVSDPSLILQTIMNSLGLKEVPGSTREDTLTMYLADKEILIILDTCEHLISDCSRIVEMFLSKCRKLNIIATSREALNCSGEQTYRLPSLSLPDNSEDTTIEKLSRFESVRLFIERALSVNPNFLFNNKNASALAGICIHLDGIPLAIELAAARVKVLSVEKIHERLGDCFNLLTEGKRNALPRQQTLKALIDWSYDLLSDKEKILWNRLSVFSGGWTLEYAEEICSDEILLKQEILNLLSQLTEKSIIIYDDVKERYMILETLKQYGEEKLNDEKETEKTLSKHLHYLMELSEKAEPHLKGSDMQIWLDKLEADQTNFQSAIEWSVKTGDIETGVRLAVALKSFWVIRGHYSNYRQLLEKILENENGISRSSLGKVLHCTGIMAMYMGDHEKAIKYYEDSLSIRRENGEKAGIADTLHSLGSVSYYVGKYEQALKFFEESLSIRRERKDKHGIAMSLNNLGSVLFNQNNYELARKYYEESIIIQREIGEKRSLSHSLHNLGSIEFEFKNFEKARELFEESLELARKIGERMGIAYSLNTLSYLSLHERKYDQARKFIEESLSLNVELGERWGIIASLISYASIFSAGEHLRMAVILIGVIETALKSISRVLEKNQQKDFEELIKNLHEKLSDEEYSKYYEEGKGLTIEQACQLVMSNE